MHNIRLWFVYILFFNISFAFPIKLTSCVSLWVIEICMKSNTEIVINRKSAVFYLHIFKGFNDFKNDEVTDDFENKVTRGNCFPHYRYMTYFNLYCNTTYVLAYQNIQTYHKTCEMFPQKFVMYAHNYSLLFKQDFKLIYNING